MLTGRVELAMMLRKKGYKVGAEVGVFDGYYSEILCRVIPGLKLYSIDSWQAYHGYGDHKNQRRLEAAYEKAKDRLVPYDCELIQKFSMDAVQDFANESLDFVYIDGNHGYDHVKEDVAEWTKKVAIGGIVSGDDFYMMRSGNMGVVRAVQEYASENGYNLQITLWDLGARKEDDRQPQWYFVRSH